MWKSPPSLSFSLIKTSEFQSKESSSFNPDFPNLTNLASSFTQKDNSETICSWSEFDQDNNKIFDTLDALFKIQSHEFFRIFINVNRTAPNFVNTLDTFKTASIQIFSENIFGDSLYLAGNWSRISLLGIQQNSEIMDTILYMKIDEESHSTMLESLNQMQLNMPEFYALDNMGDPTMRLAILDRGIDPSHPVFQGKDIYWKDFTKNNYTTAIDTTGHGTACASIATGIPYQALDSSSRTTITNSFQADWGTNFDLNLTYLWFVGAINVTEPGIIEYNFTYSLATDSGIVIDAITLLDENGGYVANQSLNGPNLANLPINYNVVNGKLGLYRFGYLFRMPYKYVNMNTKHSVQCDIHVPYSILNLTYGSSTTTNQFRGVAPNVQLAVLRVAFESEIFAAMSWLLQNAKSYNITTVSVSLGINSVAILDLANALVNAGIVVVASAGNDGPGQNTAGTTGNAPGSAKNVISVGAITRENSVASYSAQGGYFESQSVIKPDLVAPGGEIAKRYSFNTPLIVADSNDGEFISETVDNENKLVTANYFSERVYDDTRFMSGTSFSAPFVAGVVLLLINQMGGMKNWTYSRDQALFIKNLLLLSASETAPNWRYLFMPNYSPSLDRGIKDIHEGYGKINPLTALSLLNQTFTENLIDTITLYSANSTSTNIFYNQKYPIAQGYRLKLMPGYVYQCNLLCSSTLDADIYVYDSISNSNGEPMLIASSINNITGDSENILRLYSVLGKDVFILIKAIIGHGQANFTLNKIKDTSSPHSISVNFPNFVRYHSKTISMAFFAKDDQTEVVKVELLANKLNEYGELVDSHDQSVINFTYALTALWNTNLLEDGWYSIRFRFYDVANNTITTNIFQIGIDNTAPENINIISPTNFQRIGSRLQVTFNAQDLGSGLSTVELLETSQNISVLTKDYSILNQSSLYYIENRTIHDTLIYDMDSTWDGIRFLQVNCLDQVGNIGQSTYVVIIVDQNIFDLQFIIFLIGLFTPSLLIVYKGAKYILTEIDLEKLWTRFLHIPSKIQQRLNKKPFHSTRSNNSSNNINWRL